MRLHIVIAALVLAPAALGAADALPPPAENPWRERGFLHFAHQGGEIEAPSNTMFAFKEAVRKGADVLEMDVHMTADGHLVVLHDATVDRTTDGSGRVDAMTLAEIQSLDAAYWFVPGVGTTHSAGEDEYAYRGVATGARAPPAGYAATDFRIPALRGVLAEFPAMLVNIEIKNSAPDTTPYEADLAALLTEFGRGDDAIVVSFLDQSTELFRVFAPHVSTATGTGEAAFFWASAQQALPGAPSHHHALQVPILYEGLPVVTQDFVDDAHANGLAVHVWTVNERADMEWLLDLGVDGIMTDRPTLLEQVLAERGE